MAAAIANRVRRLIDTSQPAETRALMLTLQGVNAANQNDWPTAREDFLRAYSLDHTSAFTLNNRGYVAEHDGDLETAQFFYGKARKSDDANAQVGIATAMSAKGQPLGAVAANSNQKVETALEIYSRERRGKQGPIELTPRGSNPNGDTG